MKTKKKKIDLEKELDSLFDYSDDEQDLQFEEMVLNSSAINTIQDLMNGSQEIKTQVQLAEKLGVSKARISKLFSGNQYVNIKFLARIQRLFNMRFKMIDSREIRRLEDSVKTFFEVKPMLLMHYKFDKSKPNEPFYNIHDISQREPYIHQLKK